jgi:3-dehydrosphinganine reductase
VFKDKVIIITGGSSGAGKEMAARLARRGAHLALVARDREKLAAVKKEISAGLSPGQKIRSYSCDLTDPAVVEKTFREIRAEIGPPDILINSAGVLYEGYFEKQTLKVFRELMEINFFGTLHCIRAVLPDFRKKGGGRIVNICSMAGLMGIFGYSAYCASKHAVAGLTHSLRNELKPQNIRFHLVCPGEFESPMVEKVNAYRSPENRSLVHTIPVLKASDVAEAVIKGVERGDYLIIPGATARLLERLNRWRPGFSRFFTDWRLKKVYRGPRAES